MEEPGAAGSASLLSSLRGLADSVFGSITDRVELLAVELHEEKHRLIQTFIWITAFIFSALLAALFVSAAIIVVFWHTPARVPVMVGLAAVYTLAAVIAGWRLRRCLHQPRPFRATVDELRRDRACLLPEP